MGPVPQKDQPWHNRSQGPISFSPGCLSRTFHSEETSRKPLHMGCHSHDLFLLYCVGVREMKNLGRICFRVVIIEFASLKPRPTTPKSQLKSWFSEPSSLANPFLSLLLGFNVYYVGIMIHTSPRTSSPYSSWNKSGRYTLKNSKLSSTNCDTFLLSVSPNKAWLVICL